MSTTQANITEFNRSTRAPSGDAKPVYGDNLTENELQNAIQDYSEWAVDNLDPLSEVQIDTVTIEIGNMKRAAGKAIFDRNTGDLRMRFSQRAYDAWGWDGFTSTIRHELIHIWQYQQHNKADHGLSFKLKADKLDCSVSCETFHEEYTYELFCDECDSFVAGRHQKSKPVKNPQDYKSKCCDGANLYVK